MSSFVNSFTSGPVGTNPANALDTYLREDTKQALNERYSVEHYALDSATLGATDSSSPSAQGRHVPGKVGVVGVGTTTQRTALTGMGNGALFLDTTTGYFYYYTSGAGWAVLPFGYTGVIASDAEVDTGTVENKAVNPKQLKDQVDTSLIKLTAGSEALSLTSAGSYVFTIADFVGTSIDTDKIRELYVELSAEGSGGSVKVTFEDATVITLCKGDLSGVASVKNSIFTSLPIDSTFTQITLTLAGTATCNLLYVRQIRGVV